ncbi:hypothetical protein CRUP_016244 [Coryphaenoides rupestris]|nr:hypothetical protein CRUP_016244 [Coryphaenoides rupestris]
MHWPRAASCVTSNHNAGRERRPWPEHARLFQTLQATADWSLALSEEETTCLSLLPRLQADLSANMASRGLCSLLLPVSGRSVSMCDDTSFRLHCESDDIMSLEVTWTAMLSDIPTSDLPDLHDLVHFLQNPRLVDGVQGILGNYPPSLGTSELIARKMPSFGCASGFHLDTEGTGCAGSFSSRGTCLLCPEGTYQEEEGRDLCDKCPRGSSAIGALSVRQCRTECQRRGLRCSEDGSFLSAQPDFLSGTWSCVTSQGAELLWTNSETPLTDGECRGQEFSTRLGKSFERMTLRKALSGVVRTVVFSTTGTTLTDGHRYCQDQCARDPCCDGFILNSNVLEGGSILCGLMRTPSVLQCADQDWDVIGQGTANRVCGVGLTYNKQQRSLLFNFGGQELTITESALPADSKNKTDYQASIVSFQAIYLQTASVERRFEPLPEDAVVVDPSRSPPGLSYWLNKEDYNSQQALLWCLKRCDEEEQCSLVDVRQDDSDIFHSCLLFPDSTVCGAYDKKLRQPLDLSGAVKSFYSRVSFQKMVAYSVRGRSGGPNVSRGEGSRVVDRPGLSPFGCGDHALPPGVVPETWASCLQPGDEQSAASSEDCLYLNIFTPAGLRGPVPVLVFFFNPSANQSPGLLDGSALAAMGNIVVVTASFRTAVLGFLSTGHSGLHGNYGMLDQAAVLRWVDAHISLVGGDNKRVTVGAERRGADITSLHLLSSSSSPPLFQRMMLMGGSLFSPAALQSSSAARRQAVELASQLDCLTSDPSSPSEEDKMAACLRQTPVHALNAAQTKLLAASGPFQAWSPVSEGVLSSVRQPISRSPLHSRVPLLIGTSAEDGLISRAAKIKDFEALQGRADSKTAFYAALTRSLGGESSRPVVKQAASWFYSLQHSASPAGYNLLSRALDNATRDQFIMCPVQQMASHWASNKANVFLYHLPENRVHHSDPNRAQSGSRQVPGAGLPQWGPVLPAPASPQYKELDPSLQQQQGLRQAECSFWTELVPQLNGEIAELGAESAQATLTPDLSVTLPSSQSQTEKEGYN